MLTKRNLSYLILISVLGVNLFANIIYRYQANVLDVFLYSLMAFGLVAFVSLSWGNWTTLKIVSRALFGTAFVGLMLYVTYRDYINTNAVANLILYGTIILGIAGFIVGNEKNNKTRIENLNLLAVLFIVFAAFNIFFIIYVCVDGGLPGYSTSDVIVVLIITLITFILMHIITLSSIYNFKKFLAEEADISKQNSKTKKTAK